MRDIFPPNFGENNNAFGGGRSPEESNVKAISYCPVCHYHYNPVQAKILEEGEGAHLVHIRCKRCFSSILALIISNPFGVSSVGLVTDLDGREVVKFKDLSEVGEDDILSVYKFLKSDKINEIFAR